MLPTSMKHASHPCAPGSWRSGPRLLRAAGLCAAVLTWTSLFAAGGHGQEPAPDDPATAEVPLGGEVPGQANERPEQSVATEPTAADGRVPIRYVGPDTYILKDAAGRVQSMPGMTYEDFMAAWKQLQHIGPPERSRRYTIERIEINGRATDTHAELDLTATVRLMTDGAVPVPLGLSSAILRGQPEFRRIVGRPTAAQPNDGEAVQHEQPAPETYLDFDPQQGGFVAQLVGRADERQQIALRLFVPLVRDGKGAALPLTFPRTVTSSLTFDIPRRIVDASVTSGTLIAQETVGDGTRVTVAGAMGAFRLAWQTAGAASAEFTSVLVANGAIRVAVDGRSVRSIAELTVQSNGGSFDRLQIRLPVGAQLIPNPPPDPSAPEPGYRLSIEPAVQEGTAEQSETRQTVVVELREKQRGPLSIQLTTEQPIGPEDADSAVELSGFEVVGAVRQYGDIALQVAPDWQAQWNVGSFVRQVEPGELSSAMRQPNITAAFQYDRQPWSLSVRVAARRQRVLVAPQYELECSSEEVRLAVHLTYQILGARAFDLRVNLKGWELTADALESGGLVDAEQVHVTDDDVLVLPLAQSSVRRAEVAFRLKRAIDPASPHIQLPLPVPAADSVSPAILSVRPAAGIDLEPDVANSTALVPQPSSDSSSLGGAEYRFRVTATDAVFSAEQSARMRETSHSDTIIVYADEPQLRVEQHIAYVVRHQPIRELTFNVPAELLIDPDRIRISLVPTANGGADRTQEATPLAIEPLDERDPSNSPRDAWPLRVSLPQPRLGEFTVSISYPLRTAGQQPGRVLIPLLRPADGDSTQQRAEVHHTARTVPVVDPAAEVNAWTATESPETNDDRGLALFVAQRPEQYLPLLFQTVNRTPQTAVVVERVWLQTWMSHDRRQDRAAFRFRTADPQVTVELAPQTPAEMEVLLDGKLADVASRDTGRIVVNLHAPAAPRGPTSTDTPSLHTLELRYRVPIQAALAATHTLTPPQLVGTSTLAEMYWQVVLPSDRHVVRSPTRLASADRWQWQGMYFGRDAGLPQPELEQWVGAAPQLGPSAAENSYLYSGIAPLATIELVTAPRWLIVLVASGGVLALALAGIYLPVLRRPWLLFFAALAVVGLAFVFPTAALLLAQASLLGVALAGLAALLARLVARPVQWVVVPASAVSRRSTPRPDSTLVPAKATTGSTSPTVTLRVPAHE